MISRSGSSFSFDLNLCFPPILSSSIWKSKYESHLYMKGATVAVLGWLYCCCGWGSCTLIVLLAVDCVPLATRAALWCPFPSVEARLEEDEECRLSLWSPRPPPRRILRGLSLSLPPRGSTELFTAPFPVFLLPGFGMPLCTGAGLSFLVPPTLPPLGMKLAILEAFLGSASEGATSSLTSLISTFSEEGTRFDASFPFLSFSLARFFPFLYLQL